MSAYDFDLFVVGAGFTVLRVFVSGMKTLSVDGGGWALWEKMERWYGSLRVDPDRQTGFVLTFDCTT